MAVFLRILGYIALPIIQMGMFLTTRGGKLLTACTTFVTLFAGLWYFISSNSSPIIQMVQKVSTYASNFSSYLDTTSSFAQAVLYYAGIDHLYTSFAGSIALAISILAIIIVSSVALVLASVIPIILAHIGAYCAKGVQSSFQR